MHPFIRRLAYKLLPGSARLRLMQSFYVRRHRAGAGESEPEVRWLGQFIAPGDTVADIGANFGFYTRVLSRLVGPGGRVHAFEPVPDTAHILEHVVRTLPLANVTVHACALGDHEGRAEMQVPQEAGAANFYLAHLRPGPNPVGAAGGVPLATLDALRGRGVGPLAFVKCDVEGAEAMVLRGATRVLLEDRPVLLVEVCGHAARFGSSPAEVFAWLAARGYRARKPSPDGLVDCPAPEPAVVNYFFVPA